MTSLCMGVSLDATLEALADKRRRLILRHLRETASGVATCEELADRIRTHRSLGQDHENVRTRLHHVSLPKLENAALIEYDPRSNTVRYQPRSEAEELIEFIESLDGQ